MPSAPTQQYPKAVQNHKTIRDLNLDMSRYRQAVFAQDPDPDLQTPGFYLVQADEPRLARWLTLNANDRTKVTANETFLARQMDKYDPRVRTVKFDDRGCLRDGQHILSAAHKTGSTILLQVETGVPQEVFRYVDSGMSRQLGARAHFTGNHEADKRIASTVNFWSAYREHGGHPVRMATDEALAFFRAHEPALRWVTNVVTRISGPNKPACLAGLCEYYQKNVWMANQFASCLFDRESVEVQQAVYLRQRLTEDVGKYGGGGVGQKHQFLLTVSACVAHMENRVVRKLQERDW